MEDPATLWPASKPIANWLHHGITDEARGNATFHKMVWLVDRHSEGDAAYEDMAPNVGDSVAYYAALDWLFKARSKANSYTDPALHSRHPEVETHWSGHPRC